MDPGGGQLPPIEVGTGRVEASSRPDQALVGLFAVALVAGVFIAIGNALGSDRVGVSAGTPTPPPTQSPSPTPRLSATPQATADITPTIASSPHADSPWSRAATEHRGLNGSRFVVDCPVNGTPAPVWGTDVYTDDSSVCAAAVHYGAITLQGGGTVVIEIRPGLDAYPGTMRNGIRTSDWDAWGGSYVIVWP